jgi:hypothetical protein
MDKYARVKTLGKGSFGAAILVTSRANPAEKFVVKEVDVSRMPRDEREAARLEAQLLAALHHPNIVTCHESFTDRGKLCIVMDYCERGDLYQLLKAQVRVVAVGAKNTTFTLRLGFKLDREYKTDRCVDRSNKQTTARRAAPRAPRRGHVHAAAPRAETRPRPQGASQVRPPDRRVLRTSILTTFLRAFLFFAGI